MSDNSSQRAGMHGMVVPMLILGVCIIVSVFIFTSAWTASKEANQTIYVTGSAKKEFVADLGVLSGTLTVMDFSQSASYRKLKDQKPVILKYLKSQGFAASDVEFSPSNGYAEFEFNAQGRRTNVLRGWVYSQRIKITSNDVQKIKDLSLDMTSLVEKGLNFSVDAPEYYYTKLQDMKVEVQALAAKDAMERAKKVAEATGRSLGPIRSARMGVLQITSRNSNMVSDYGVNDVSSIEKEITAVVSGDFQLE
jgi:uncharacterized protein